MKRQTTAMETMQNDMQIHDLECVEKRVSTLTRRVEQLEKNPPKTEDNREDQDGKDDDDFPKIEADVVYGSDGVPDSIRSDVLIRLASNKE